MANVELTEEERIKAIPGKEMAGAIKSMNEYLAGKSLELIVTKDTTKKDAVDNLLAPIVAAIENEEAADLPEDVIAFYNDHLVVADPEEEVPEPAKGAKAKKAKKEPKEKKPKAPKKPSNEENAYNMVVAGKSTADILEHFKDVYAGKGKDDAFIAKRAGIYENIGKRKYASENADFKAKWDAEKEAAKPVKPVKEKKEKVPAKEKAVPKAKTKTKVVKKVAPKAK